METVDSATLDGSTHGAITISAGSTYTAARSGFNDTTNLTGMITNNGTILLNGGNNANGIMALIADATLTGSGHIVLANNTDAGTQIIEALSPGITLNNVSNSIQGTGNVGNGTGLAISNQTGGTFDANAAGQSLNLNGSAAVTNMGAFQAETTSTLGVSAPMTNITGTAGTTETLTGGTYFANGGTIQLNSFGSLAVGGELINNAAILTLNGITAAITDANGNNALRNLSNNMASGALNVQGGYSFTTAAPLLTNFGSLNLGASSNFNVGSGGTGTYTQNGAGASTLVSGTFTAATLNLDSGNFTVAGGGKINVEAIDVFGGIFFISQGGDVDPLAIDITGGTMQGAGSITGDVNNSGGNVEPASAPSIPGTLTINGNYAQGSGGTLTVDLGGIAPGDFSVLNVSDLVALDGTVEFTAVDGFTPGSGDEFTFLLFGGTESGNFASMDLTNWTCPVGDVCTDVFAANSLTLEISGSSTTPEPSEMLLLATGLLALSVFCARKRRPEAER